MGHVLHLAGEFQVLEGYLSQEHICLHAPEYVSAALMDPVSAPAISLAHICVDLGQCRIG